MAGNGVNIPNQNQKVLENDANSRFSTPWYYAIQDIVNILGASASGTVITTAFIDNTPPADGSILIGDLSSNKYFKSSYVIPTSVTQGDLWYASSSSVVTALAKNSSATRYLTNTGTSNNPAWGQVNLTNGVTGTLPIANGGTNLTAVGTSGTVLTSNGSAASWDPLPTFTADAMAFTYFMADT